MAHDLQTRISSRFAALIARRPGPVLLVLLAVVAGSALLATRLSINTNQLELIDQDLRAVQDVKRVVDMAGGAGHLLVALRCKDEKTIKAVADDIAEMLTNDKENIHHIFYKVSTEFVLERAALFMKTEDLQELRRRGMAFLEDRIRRADPFYFEIKKTEPVKLEVEDIVAPYRKVGKKTITDDYWISDDKEVLMLVVKPNWNSTELGRTKEFIDAFIERLGEYSKTNTHGVTLVEDYTPQAPDDPKVVEFGFSGTYKLAYDESAEIAESLVPVGGIAFAGVCLVMLLFFGRRLGAIVLVITGLFAGVVISFGFAELAVGELNTITSMLAGILMGLGIDFGIHVVYRLREELAHGAEVSEAVFRAVTYQGPASFISALGICCAFFSLMFSDFHGFSQFGILAGGGVFLIGTAIYAWIPSVLMMGEGRIGGLARAAIGTVEPEPEGAGPDRIPRPWLLLGGGLALALGLGIFAPEVKFDYNTRALIVEDRPSMKLHDEIIDRFDISADPMAIYTPDLESTKAVWDELTEMRHRYSDVDVEKYPSIDQVVSLWTFVPPQDQQERNVAILQEVKAELADIDPAVLPPEFAQKWEVGKRQLDAKPYTVDDLPDYILERFIPGPDSKYEGYLTFVYPPPTLWDGKRLIEFADEVEFIRTDKGEFTAAGLPILYAYLAKIVLRDARFAVILTTALLLVILLIDLRSFVKAMVAMLPLALGILMMLGAMPLVGLSLNFMNIVVFPIVIGYGVSHGVYLMHRFDEGTSPRVALRSVGTAVACSTLTTLAGWAALLAAPHRGLQTVGALACLGMSSTLVVSFTIMPAVMQILHDRRVRKAAANGSKEDPSEKAAA